MRDFARKSPTFWTRGTGKRLRGHKDAQILVDYLTSSPSHNAIGLYSIGLPNICHETGLRLDEVLGAFKLLEKLEFALYDEEEEVVWIKTMVLWQFGIEPGETLRPGNGDVKGDNKIRAILKDLINAPRHAFVRSFYDMYEGRLGLGEKPVWVGALPPLPRVHETPSKGVVAPLAENPPTPLPGNSNSNSKGVAERSDAAAESGFDLAQRVWKELWAGAYGEKFHVSPNTGKRGDEQTLQRIGRLALAHGSDAERFVRAKVAGYLANRTDWLVKNRHPLLVLESDWSRYDGAPPASDPTEDPLEREAKRLAKAPVTPPSDEKIAAARQRFDKATDG